MTDRIRLIQRASALSIAGNALLAAGKIAAGFFSGSLAVVGDGIDSSTDVVVSLITLVAARVAGKPGDREHPYGHGRAETIATVILAFIVCYAGVQLVLSSIADLLSASRPEMPGSIALIASAVSIAGKLALAWTQFAAGKKANSAMLIANGKNMRNDVVISASVLAGLAATFAFGLPILDRALALLVGAWVVKGAIGIFIETNAELMDGVGGDARLYARVFKAIASVDGAGNPHRTRVRKLAASYVVDTDIEVDPELSVRAAHDIAMRVEGAIKREIEDVYDVLVHVEPRGNVERDERFGLRHDDVDGIGE
jgi:cation diffusion facilitator family transporter